MELGNAEHAPHPNAVARNNIVQQGSTQSLETNPVPFAVEPVEAHPDRSDPARAPNFRSRVFAFELYRKLITSHKLLRQCFDQMNARKELNCLVADLVAQGATVPLLVRSRRSSP